jgi:hypothetical protein
VKYRSFSLTVGLEASGSPYREKSRPPKPHFEGLAKLGGVERDARSKYRVEPAT